MGIKYRIEPLHEDFNTLGTKSSLINCEGAARDQLTLPEQGRRNRSSRPGNCRTNVLTNHGTCQRQAALSVLLRGYIATYLGSGSRESVYESSCNAAKLEVSGHIPGAC